jgi:large subunit ribosomal protein L9
MEIILTKDIKGLGFKNDLVSVRPGYGRNFLLPKELAILATASNKKQLAETIKQQAFKEEKSRKTAVENAGKLAELKLSIGAKAGESGKIFGAVTTIQISEALKKAGFDIDRKNIELGEDGIKQLGNYTAKVYLYKEINSTLNFEVISE